MKMGITDRLLLTIYTLIISLVSIALLVFFIAIGVNAIPLREVNAALNIIELNWQFFLVGSLVSIFFLIVSIKLLFTGTRTKVPSSSLLKHTELGIIRVSINALEVMIQKAVRRFDEVKDVRVNTIADDDGIRIQLKLLIMPEVVLPDLTASIQQKVKEYIESYSGIVVKEILIYIDNFSAPQQRPKVQ